MDGTGAVGGIIGALIYALIQAALTWRKDRAAEQATEATAEHARTKDYIATLQGEMVRVKADAEEDRKRFDDCQRRESALQVRVARLETILESNGITYQTGVSGAHRPITPGHDREEQS